MLAPSRHEEFMLSDLMRFLGDHAETVGCQIQESGLEAFAILGVALMGNGIRYSDLLRAIDIQLESTHHAPEGLQ